MCLAIPVQIIAIDEQGLATVSLSGVERRVSLVMTPEAKVGDYVLVHTGFALNVLDEQEAQATLALFQELEAVRGRVSPGQRVVKYIDEFRDPATAERLVRRVKHLATGRRLRLMEFCGGHTHAIGRFGLGRLLAPEVELLSGPGCPVCVTSAADLDYAIALASAPGVMLATFGDMMRVPGSRGRSLQHARSEGADVRLVYSPLDALELAASHPYAPGGAVGHRL